MSQVIILGDVHLGKNTALGKVGIGALLNSRIVDQLNLLEWTLDQAVEQHADHIIITGDVFEDPKPLPSLITLFIGWLKKCQAYNVHVHIILGNHDILRSGQIYSSPLDIISEVELENVTVYKDTNTIIINRTSFTLVPFRDRKSFDVESNAIALNMLRESLVYELASIPVTYSKVLIGHLAIEGSIPVGDEIDDISNELFCPIDMFNGYDFVWMGHVHKPQIMKKQNPFVAHIGSMDISNFGETDQKKYIIVFNTFQSTYNTIYLPTRALKKINIVVPKDTVDSTEYVLEEVKKLDPLNKSIVRLEVSLSDPSLKSVNKSVIEKHLISQGAFSVTGIAESKKTSLIKKDSKNTINTNMDVLSAINVYADKYVDSKIKSKFIELAVEIYKLSKSGDKE